MFKRKLILALIAAILTSSFTGCNSEAEKRQAAKLRWQRQSATAKIPVAEDLLQNDQVDDALNVINECLAALDDNARAHLVKGKILYMKGKIAQADDSLNLAVKYDPELDEAWFWLGMLQQKTRDLKLSMKSYNKAMELEPSKAEYIVAVSDIYALQGDYEAAIKLLKYKSDLMQFNNDLKTALADLHLRRGNIDQAIEIYNRVLSRNPDDSDVIAAVGYCYVIDQQWAKASEVFEKLLDKTEGEKKQTYLEMLAAININNDEYGKAVKFYDSLVLSNRDNADAWLKMGHAALGANAPKRAMACAKRALNLRSCWADAIALKGCAQYLSEDYTQSLSSFERIRGNKDLSCFAWLMTGRCLRKIGEHEMASAAFKKAAKLDPGNELVAYLNK